MADQMFLGILEIAFGGLDQTSNQGFLRKLTTLFVAALLQNLGQTPRGQDQADNKVKYHKGHNQHDRREQQGGFDRPLAYANDDVTRPAMGCDIA